MVFETEVREHHELLATIASAGREQLEKMVATGTVGLPWKPSSDIDTLRVLVFQCGLVEEYKNLAETRGQIIEHNREATERVKDLEAKLLAQQAEEVEKSRQRLTQTVETADAEAKIATLQQDLAIVWKELEAERARANQLDGLLSETEQAADEEYERSQHKVAQLEEKVGRYERGACGAGASSSATGLGLGLPPATRLPSPEVAALPVAESASSSIGTAFIKPAAPTRTAPDPHTTPRDPRKSPLFGPRSSKTERVPSPRTPPLTSPKTTPRKTYDV